MVRWYASGPRDVGNQTRAVLGDAARHGSSPRAAAETFQQRRPDAAGNGALMRTGPVALAALGDREAVARLATAVAELTHPHPDSVEACVLWSLAIERAITTARPDQPFDWVAAVAAGLDHVDAGRRDLWRSRIDEAAGRDPTDFHHNNGWVVAAFQAALAAITATADDAHALPCDHLTAALRRVARSGGDTDTVAAIAGALLGARWGATAVPLTWRRRLHGRRIYGEPALTAADLDAMARLAVRGGRPDPSGWPGVDHLDYGTMPSRFVELDGAWFGNVGGIVDAVDDGATVVVSLCRMGTDDVPRRGRAPHRRPHRHHRRRQPQRRVRPPRHRPDDRRPRRSRRAGVHPLRCRPAPCAIDGGGVPHHPRRRRRDGDRSGRRRPRRHAISVPARRPRRRLAHHRGIVTLPASPTSAGIGSGLDGLPRRHGGVSCSLPGEPAELMPTRPHHRTLTAQLRDWTADQVATLLLRRPDLARPRPADLGELAQRAQQHPSVTAAIDRTTLAENRLLQLVVCCRPDVPLAELGAALPAGTALADVEPVLASLEEAALLWRHDGRVHCSGTLRQLMPTPFGPPLHDLASEQQTSYLKSAIDSVRTALAASSHRGELPPPATGPDGRPPRKAELVEELERLVSTPGVVAAVLESAPAEAVQLAADLLAGPPYVEWSYYLTYSTYQRYYESEPGYWLYRHALVLPVPRSSAAAQPREVSVALRGGRPIVDLALDRPDFVTHRVDQHDVDAQGAARAVQALHLVDELLDAWWAAPVKALQSGGLGVSVTKQVATMLDVDPAVAELLIELAYVAGLIEQRTVSRTERRKYVSETFVEPSAAAAAWTSRPDPVRWRQLAGAWQRADYWPSASGRQPDGAKPVPLLSPQYAAAGAAERREVVLEALAALDDGAATTLTDLAAALYWAQPQPWLRHGPGDGTLPIEWVWTEAELLGIVAAGSPTSFGRALIARDDAAAESALAAAEPRHETAFTLQADLTATVVGTLAREVLTELRLLADVESTGAATTFRFSEGSLRRAFDAGRSAAEITSFLERHAAKGVPQPLAYLVGDVARRHGHLRVGDAGSFVTSDDPAVLADACTHRRTRKLALRLLAPTVAVSPRPPDAVLEGLRAAGFLPTADALDGTVEIAAPEETATESPADAADGQSGDGPLPERFPTRRATRTVVDETAATKLAAEILAAPAAGTTHVPASPAHQRWPSTSTAMSTTPSERSTTTTCSAPPSAPACSPSPSATSDDSRAVAGGAVERRGRPHRRLRSGRPAHRLDPTRAHHRGDRSRRHRRLRRGGTSGPAPRLGAAALDEEAAVSDGPLVVQSDKTLLLEIDHPLAEECRLAIAGFAELERAPEHIHTYRITPLGLWNARAAGVDAEHVVDVLLRYSRFPPPQALLIDVADTIDRHGRLVLEQDPIHGLVLRARDRAVLEEVVRSKHVSPLLGPRLTDDLVSVPVAERGRLKQALLKVGWPADDQAGYVDGASYPVVLDDAGGFALRPYQISAIDTFLAAGSGVVVLPCGAGKTLVGAGAMARTSARTLILVTNTVAARQWRAELLARTSLTDGEIGEYSGERKEIRPVTIATYQILVARSKGEYRHFAVFDAEDWGLIIYDEVHLLPAPVFRMTAEIQSRRRLGLTATLVREDGREGDVFSLIGPKRFDTPWRQMESQGWIAPASCTEVRVTLTDAERMAYAVAEPEQRHQVGATARSKLEVVDALLARHAGEPTLVIGMFVEQLGEIAERLAVPLITGKTAGTRPRTALRCLPPRRRAGARRVEGRQLLDRPARRLGGDPGVGHVRQPPGGGAAARPHPAPEGERAPGALLHRRQPRHQRAGVRRQAAALPRRAGLQLRHRRRRRRRARRVAILASAEATGRAGYSPTGQCWSLSSSIGKSAGLPVASAAPTPIAAAAIRQSAWWTVTPWLASERLHVPASSPSATPSGASRRPRKSRRAAGSSCSRIPRQISSTEIAHTHGSSPTRRISRSRWAAGRPRSTSMSTVESSSSRAIVSRHVERRRAVPSPTRRGRHPSHDHDRRWRRSPTPVRPSAARRRARDGSVPPGTRCAGGCRGGHRARPPAHPEAECAGACA